MLLIVVFLRQLIDDVSCFPLFSFKQVLFLTSIPNFPGDVIPPFPVLLSSMTQCLQDVSV